MTSQYVITMNYMISSCIPNCDILCMSDMPINELSLVDQYDKVAGWYQITLRCSESDQTAVAHNLKGTTPPHQNK